VGRALDCWNLSKCTQQGAGIWIAASGVGRARCAASRSGSEAKLSVDVSPSDLILAAALVENAKTSACASFHKGQVVVHVDSGVGLEPWSSTQVAPTKVHAGNAGEAHVRDGLAGRDWIKER